MNEITNAGMKLSTDHTFYHDRGMKLSTDPNFYHDYWIQLLYFVSGLVRYGARRYDMIQYEQLTAPRWSTVKNDAITIWCDAIIQYDANNIRRLKDRLDDGTTPSSATPMSSTVHNNLITIRYNTIQYDIIRHWWW